MSQPTVVITVDCVSALEGKCYLPELVAVAEEFMIPITWLLGVSEHDPMSNVKLYHNEYIHRTPSWHELGLFLTFDTSLTNTIERGDLIRVGKDILKQFSIKPTAFRAANGDLESGDLKALEDIGILVDVTLGSTTERPASASACPYHPDYDLLHQEGDSKVWIVPVANQSGARGYVDAGFHKIKPVIDAQLAVSSVICLGATDTVDNASNLRATIAYLTEKGARFVTLTQLASELQSA